MNVISNGPEILALFNRQRLVSTLKQMPPNLVSRIESLCIGALKPSHAVNKVWFRGFKQKVVMGTHQDKGMNQPAVSFRDLAPRIEKPLMILVVLEERLLAIPPAHMIGCSLKFDPLFSCHAKQ